MSKLSKTRVTHLRTFLVGRPCAHTQTHSAARQSTMRAHAVLAVAELCGGCWVRGATPRNPGMIWYHKIDLPANHLPGLLDISVGMTAAVVWVPARGEAAAELAAPPPEVPSSAAPPSLPSSISAAAAASALTFLLRTFLPRKRSAMVPRKRTAPIAAAAVILGTSAAEASSPEALSYEDEAPAYEDEAPSDEAPEPRSDEAPSDAAISFKDLAKSLKYEATSDGVAPRLPPPQMQHMVLEEKSLSS